MFNAKKAVLEAFGLADRATGPRHVASEWKHESYDPIMSMSSLCLSLRIAPLSFACDRLPRKCNNGTERETRQGTVLANELTL